MRSLLGATRLALGLLAIAATAAAAQPPVAPTALDTEARAILGEVPLLGMDRALADAERFTREHPRDVASQRLLLFVGDAARRRGDPARAAGAYEAVMAIDPSTVLARRARLGLGEVRLADGRYRVAEALVAPLATDGDGAIAAVARQRLAQARAGFAAWLAAVVAALAVLASLVGSTVAARARRLRVPREAVYAAPVLLLLAALSALADRRLVPGFFALAAVELALLSLGLRALSRSRGARAAVGVALLLVACAAALYLFVWAEGLLPALVETLRYGPDR